MKIFKCVLVLLCAQFGLSSCMTEAELKALEEAQAQAEAQRREYNRVLASSAIEELTTCKHGNLSEIRRNLIVMGYEIESLDDQVLVTKWHQYSSGNDGSMYYDKFSAVKVNSDQIKLKERRKKVYPYTEKDTQVNTIKDGSYEQRLENKKQACRKDPNSDECQKKVVRKDTKSETVSYRTTTRSSEYEPTYYAREYNSFKIERDKICGPEPVKKVDNTKTKNTTKK